MDLQDFPPNLHEVISAVSSDKQLALSLSPQTLFLGVIIRSSPNADYLRQHRAAVVITLSLSCWNKPNHGLTKRPLYVKHKHAGCKSHLRKGEKSSTQTCHSAYKTKVYLWWEKVSSVCCSRWMLSVLPDVEVLSTEQSLVITAGSFNRYCSELWKCKNPVRVSCSLFYTGSA